MKHIIIYILITTLIGCSSNGFLMAKPKVLIYGKVFPAKSIDAEIQVYETNRPTQQYSEIAKISCGDTEDSWNLKQILIKARELGADAVILTGKAGSYGTGVPIGDISYVVTENYGLTAIAIKYD